MSLNEQAENIRRSIEFIRNGSLGIITDGDKLVRPKSSAKEMNNMDYDNEVGIIETRNDFTTGLFDDFVPPTGYEIMPDGADVFSFNEPIDREIKIIFVRHPVDGDVRIFVSAWFNPPTTIFSTAYENEIDGLTRDHWFEEWIELTEVISLATPIQVLNNASFKVTNNSNLTNDRGSWYTGWFAYNPNIIDVNKRFVCIGMSGYTVSGLNSTFTIQNRLGKGLNDLGWLSGHENIKLIRYPILFHKSPSTLRLQFEKIQMIKENLSIKCLIGQSGNLWFGFINKSPYSEVREEANWNRRYGWWLDYQQFPIDPTLDEWGATYTLNEKTGISFQVDEYAETGSKIKMLSVIATLDDFQNICLSKSVKLTASADKGLTLKPRLYHHYSRRITGVTIATGGDSVKDDTYDPTTHREGWATPYYETVRAQKEFFPIYIFAAGFAPSMEKDFANPPTDDNLSTGVALSTVLGYPIEEKIFTADSFGVLSKDVLLTGGDSEKLDKISTSLIQDGVSTPDISPLQNKFNVGSSDKDKLIYGITLDKYIYLFKGNSIHIYVPKNTGDGFIFTNEISKIGTTYYRTIIKTPLGILFVNDNGIWLLSGTNTINITRESRIGEFYTLDKSQMFAIWYEHKKEAWFYIGNKKIWILKYTQKTKQLGWKDYTVAWDGIGFLVNEDNYLYLITTSTSYRIKRDNETQIGEDQGEVPISYKYRENLMLLGEQEQTRHRRYKTVEHKIFVELQRRGGIPVNGHTETINWKIYNEKEEVYDNGSWVINVDETLPEILTIRNTIAKSHRAFALEVSGTLVNCKKIRFSEFFSRAILLTQPIKGGTIKPTLV